ncbi:hypothetical protein SOVF_134940 [Spinacia oleracea]|uniref:OVATE domain-containing protein n=1 Tax=Spinacia oleracea TaxID=3562 RepID=A0A9R0IKW1_SPIOL|nr:uncharacterized protein LOC110790764 [Spinacia oleracea]KNA11448.1 hypothetical protein SOVF_134940 [Spinacia oleracea]
MLLRNSISNTKKFFQRTLDNVKSFLSVGSTYQRLPKTPPFYPFSCGSDTNNEMMGSESGFNTELDDFYNEFTHQWDSRKGKVKKTKKKKDQKNSVLRASVKKSQQENCNYYAARTEDKVKISENKGDFVKESNAEIREVLKSKGLNVIPGMMRKPELCSTSVRETRMCFAAEKLKELEMMDKGNVDHKLDVEEFLRYYSCLTCPAYLDIVDKFLVEMCTEFFGPQASPKVNYARPRLQPFKV